jgi:hypothetical protein
LLSPWWLDCQSALVRFHADWRLGTKQTIAQLTGTWWPFSRRRC